MQDQVTVVIPTAGRRQVRTAVQSALDQVDVEVEVVVVDNGRTPTPHLSSLPDRVRLLRSPSEANANGARQLGIQNATHSLVALLDDDDEWHPRKLSRQLQFGRTLGLAVDDRWVISCGTEIRRTDGTKLLAPRKFASNPLSPAHHLFRRNTFTDQHRQLQSSTLLFPRALALEVPFSASQRFHQDWTWLLGVEQLGAQVYQVPQYLVTYIHNSAGSITSASNYAASIDWARTHLTHSSRIRGDFILTVPFNMATMSGDTRGQRRALWTALSHSQPGPFSTIRALTVLAKTTLRARP